MSIIFGILAPDGDKVDREQLLRLASATERYAPDGTFVHSERNLGMGFQAYYTHERSRLDSQPASDPYGNLLVFDGRIDNHSELNADLDVHGPCLSDSLLVLAAFEHWGTKCFSKLKGDWALALWSNRDHVLYLARDHAGTRTLFYRIVNGRLLWATFLDTFFAQGERYPLDEQFAACFLAGQTVGDLTPYRGVNAVPVAHYLAISGESITKTALWDWTPKSLIHYKSDSEYEEQFFDLFRQSVRRRAGAGAPIIAELSGGMDSTSIICMSDYIRRSQGIPTDGLLDTLSYYDPQEPTWNEEQYFSLTEARRGKPGVHVQTSFAARTFQPFSSHTGHYLWPGSDSATAALEQQTLDATGARDYRVVLSGIGGDELLGGVPTPTLELADYIVPPRPLTFLRRSIEWSLVQRTPLAHALYAAARTVMALYFRRMPAPTIPAWIEPKIRPILEETLMNRSMTVDKSVRARPSSVINGRMWWSLVETLPHMTPGILARREYRYPYLDRDLVSFLFQVPREQLVRPGRRRSLMRRALREIVPPEILERRRKAYLSRTPIVAFVNARATLQSLSSELITARLGLVIQPTFERSIDSMTSGQLTTEWPMLLRTLLFEMWLRNSAGLHCELDSRENKFHPGCDLFPG